MCLVALMSLSTQDLNAALPDGSVADDFTLTDINGVSYNLYSYLDQGIPVILDFSATWCPPCWSYHQSGILKDLYNAYGPPGTGEIMVFFIEPDGSTNTACLYGPSGCVGGTQGDWVTGTPYPIIDLVGGDLSVATDYNITYYPTLYAISPDRRTWEVGQASQTTWENWLFSSFTLNASSQITHADCNNPNGLIDVTASGGYNNLIYQWSNGQSTQDVLVPPGTYDVTIRDNNNYFIELTNLTVDVSTLPIEITALSVEDVNCFGNNDGSIDLTASGGNGNYSYSWSNGMSGPMVSSLSPGLYEVTCTDPQGCEDVEMYEIFEPPFLFAASSAFPASCDEDNGLAVITGSGGVGPYLYNIGNGDSPNQTFPNLAPGAYLATVTDANGCQTYTPFAVAEIPAPTADAGFDGMIDCENSTIDLIGTASGNITSEKWFDEDGNEISNTNVVTVGAAGVYTYQVNDNGCIVTDQVSVSESFDFPTADAGSGMTMDCSVISVMLDGSGSSSGSEIDYLWTTTDGNIVDGANEVSAEVDAPGTYILEVLNTDNGCSSTSEVIVNGDFAEPMITTADAVLTCDVNSVQICASTDPGSTIKWIIPGGEVDQDCIEVNAAGNYTAVATASNGCTSEAISVVSQDVNLPVIAVEEPEEITCTVTTVTLQGDVEGDPDDFDISWTTSDGNIVEGADGLNPVVDSEGLYVLNVYAPSSGCNSVLEVFVSTSAFLPDGSFESVLDENTLNLTSTSSGDPMTFEWTLDGAVVGTDSEISLEFTETGTYEICHTAENACGPQTYCEDVQYISALIGSGNVDHPSCHDSANGIISITLSGGLPGYTISWTGPNGFTSDQETIEGLAPGIYTATVEDAAGNEYEESFEITAPAEVSATADVINLSCFGDMSGSISVNGSGGTGELTYNWSNGLEGNVIENLPGGIYTVDIQDANGCARAYDYIVNEPAPISGTSIIEDIQCNGDANGSINLIAEGGTGTLNYEWSDGVSGNERTDLTPGDYSVIVMDENGCSETYDYTISEPDALDLESVTTGDENNGSEDGFIDVNVTGGVAPYDFLWSNGETTEDINGLEAGSYSCQVTDANGCIIELGPFEIQFISSVELINDVESFNYYPNPMNTVLQLDMELNASVDFNIDILDINGKLVHTERVSAANNWSHQIDVSQLQAGVYFLQVRSKEGSMIRKLSKF